MSWWSSHHRTESIANWILLLISSLGFYRLWRPYIYIYIYIYVYVCVCVWNSFLKTWTLSLPPSPQKLYTYGVTITLRLEYMEVLYTKLKELYISFSVNIFELWRLRLKIEINSGCDEKIKKRNWIINLIGLPHYPTRVNNTSVEQTIINTDTLLQSKYESLSFGMISILKIHHFSHNFPLKKSSHDFEQCGTI